MSPYKRIPLGWQDGLAHQQFRGRIYDMIPPTLRPPPQTGNNASRGLFWLTKRISFSDSPPASNCPEELNYPHKYTRSDTAAAKWQKPWPNYCCSCLCPPSQPVTGSNEAVSQIRKDHLESKHDPSFKNTLKTQQKGTCAHASAHPTNVVCILSVRYMAFVWSPREPPSCPSRPI